MKPAPFAYAAPESLDEALALLSEHGPDAKALAGGQSLVPLLNLRLARPAALVDLRRIEELRGMTVDGGVRIGATTRQADALRDAALALEAPLLGVALRHVGHMASRARGTLGGSLAHADPAAELPAVALVLDARVVVRSVRGERALAASELCTGPFTTALEPDELLVELRLPRAPGRRHGFAELTRRWGDFALAGVACTATVEDGVVRDARVALFGVAPSAVRATEAEHALEGRPLADALEEAAQAVPASADPSSDIHASAAYRRRVLPVLARRALAALAGEEAARAA